MSLDFDESKILNTYLLTQSAVTDLIGDRLYCPRAPENAGLPNITHLWRGGRSTPYIPDIPTPSVQIDCWAETFSEAREVYRALYNALQGIENISVSEGGKNYVILSVIEEVHGQDLMDVDVPGRFRVLSFWSIQIK